MDKIILVTGGCGGLGYQLVKRHLEQGDTVYACDIRETDAYKELAAQYPGKTFYATCDVSSTDSVNTAAAESLKDVVRFDRVYHTAGIFTYDEQVDLPETNLDTCARMYDINAVGYLRVMKAIYDKLQNTEIAAITSEAGSISMSPRSNEFSYCMSKAAENMAAVLLQHHFDKVGNGCKTMCFHPGWLRSPMGGQRALDNPQSSITTEESAERIQGIMDKIDTYDTMYIDYLERPMTW